MRLYLCTLFDSNYLDKGLVLYESLQNVCEQYTLYILPMDTKCSKILQKEMLPNVVVLDYPSFEDEQLLRLKTERSRAEFCWSCTAKLVKYIMDNFNVSMCTYIDADMFFYKNPDSVIQELFDEDASVQIVGHNFRKSESRIRSMGRGKYNVAFNTFLNNENARKIVDAWITDCVNVCSYNGGLKTFGDQKYLDKWPLLYPDVSVCKNLGADVAPWNVNRFDFFNEKNKYQVRDKESGKVYPLVFFHFQNIIYKTENDIYCCKINKKNYDIVKQIYTEYLKKIDEKKHYLYEKYGLTSRIALHPARAEKKATKINKKDILQICANKVFNFWYRTVCFINALGEVNLIIRSGE